MSENEHYDRAKKRLHNGTTNEVDRAQAEATLAIAYEQRTANLIAAIQPVRLIGGKEWLPNEATVERVRAEIDVRLYPKGKP